jgi:hypothetical protein
MPAGEMLVSSRRNVSISHSFDPCT